MKLLLSLWYRHEAELRRWLRSRAPNASEVDDLLQDVFLMTSACHVSFDDTGRVDDFIPRARLPGSAAPEACAAAAGDDAACNREKSAGHKPPR